MLWRVLCFILSVLVFAGIVNLVLKFSTLVLPLKIVSIGVVVVLMAILLSTLRHTLTA